MDAMRRLRALADRGRLVVAALHDLTLAARHATHLMALREGRLAAFGPMEAVLTAGLLRAVFSVEARVIGTEAGTLVDYLGPEAAVRPS